MKKHEVIIMLTISALFSSSAYARFISEPFEADEHYLSQSDDVESPGFSPDDCDIIHESYVNANVAPPECLADALLWCKSLYNDIEDDLLAGEYTSALNGCISGNGP